MVKMSQPASGKGKQISRKGNLIRWVSVILLATLSISLFACAAQTTTVTSTTQVPTTITATPTGGTPIKIGLTIPMSGMFGSEAPYIIAGAQMAVNDANAAGGALGRPIQLVTRDNQGDPSLVNQQLDQMQAEGCVAMCSGSIDSTDLAASAWGATNHVPIFVTSSSGAFLTTGFNKYTFQAGPASWVESNVFVDQIAKQNIKSVFFFNADIGFAYEVENDVLAGIQQRGLDCQNLGHVIVGLTETDYSSAISTCLSKHPDMVICNIVGPGLITQMQTFNFFNQTKAASVFMVSPSFDQPYGKDFPAGAQGITWTPFWSTDPAMQAFVKSFGDTVTDKTLIEPSDKCIQYYISVKAIVNAIISSNSTNADAIVSSCETSSFASPVGTVSFTPYDHQLHLPLLYVSSVISNDYPIAIGNILTTYGNEIYPTEDQIQAAIQAGKTGPTLTP